MDFNIWILKTHLDKILLVNTFTLLFRDIVNVISKCKKRY